MTTRYPQDRWLYIFTDGSEMDGYIKAGAGIYCELFSCYMPLEPHSTTYDGEIEAIRTELQLLNLHRDKFERAVIFSDKGLHYYQREQQKLILLEARDCQALI
jgi:hypothetical protein